MDRKSVKKNICPRCGKAYTARPAMARDGSGPICQDCGTREALATLGIGSEEQERIIQTIHQHQA